MALERQFFTVQKGDCADASEERVPHRVCRKKSDNFMGFFFKVEGNGFDWHWGSNPSDCGACKEEQGCAQKVGGLSAPCSLRLIRQLPLFVCLLVCFVVAPRSAWPPTARP